MEKKYFEINLLLKDLLVAIIVTVLEHMIAFIVALICVLLFMLLKYISIGVEITPESILKYNIPLSFLLAFVSSLMILSICHYKIISLIANVTFSLIFSRVVAIVFSGNLLDVNMFLYYLLAISAYLVFKLQKYCEKKFDKSDKDNTVTNF